VLGALATGSLHNTLGPRAATVVLAVLALATLVATLPRLLALEDDTSAHELDLASSASSAEWAPS
jgi:hypothetical protein